MQADQEALSNVVVVLDRPKDVVNIAGVVRVMMNMGLPRLRLVRPDEFEPERIEGIAHRSGPVIEAIELHDSLPDALADATWVVGTSARARAARRSFVRPREIAPAIVERAGRGPVAVLFGREDRGLTREGLDLCQRVAIVPTTAEHPSLNLAQACLIVCYELFLAAGAPERKPLPTRGKKARATGPATQEELERMYSALEDGLERIDFFKAREPATVLRTLRVLLARAEPTEREARLVQAMGFEIGHYLDRVVPGSDDSS